MTDTRIKVLHVVSSLGLGGTEKVMQSFVCTLDRSKFHAAAYSPSDGPRAALLRKNGIDTFINSDLLSTLEKFKPQIVHIHRAGWTQPGYLRPFKLSGTPVLVETNVFGHHDPSPDAQKIDRHLFVSHFCSRRFEKVNQIKAAKPKYSVLYNPVDTDFFTEKCPVKRSRPRNFLGRISRADKGKWSDFALNFLPLLANRIKENQLEPFRYKIIGGIPEAKKFVSKNKLEKYVEFLPPIITDGELADFFNSISFLAHANDTGESFGLVIAEAMAAGLPVITHPSAGLRDNAQLELVDDGVTGIVARSVQEYAEAVRFLLCNEDKAIEMGENGRAKAAKLFRAQAIAVQLEEIYMEVLSAKGLK